MSNAIVFSAPTEPIRVQVRRREGDVVVSVADRGVGLTDAEREHLFEKHFRPERYRESRREGLGLSLWIGRQVVDLHHGRLWVESPGANLGATFHLALPIASES